MYRLFTDKQGKPNSVEEAKRDTGIFEQPRSFTADPQSEEYRSFLAEISKSLGMQIGDNEAWPNHAVICFSREALLQICKQWGVMLHSSATRFSRGPMPTIGGVKFIRLQRTWSRSNDGTKPDEDSGLATRVARLTIPETVYDEINRELCDDKSDFRRVSSTPIERTFVYLDISDFSKQKPGIQALVINNLVGILRRPEWWGEGQAADIRPKCEAMLCIGDGYIYVFDDPFEGTYFAAYLAQLIETLVAMEKVTEFHFRMGVHAGPVYSFWDPGRRDWNYIGKGINGGSRVLEAVGKEQDDVLFISGDVRRAIHKKRNDGDQYTSLLNLLSNRGRKNDKHGNPWRVYEVNHTALCELAIPPVSA